MNIYSSYRYQMSDQKRGLIVFFSAVTGLTLLIMAIVFITLQLQPGLAGEMTGEIGVGNAAIIYVFVASLCSFKENFGMSLQNGTSRRSLFLARLGTAATVSVICAVADQLLTLFSAGAGAILHMNITSQSLIAMIYGAEMEARLGFALAQACSLALSFFLLLAASAMGYFTTILFYRLNKLGKILIGAGVPCLLFIGLPLLEVLDFRFFNGAILHALGGFLGRIMTLAWGQPQNAALTSFLLFAAFSAFSWLLMRRAVVKK